MSEHKEISLTALRVNAGDVIHRVAVLGESLILTDRGRPVAAVVPLAVLLDRDATIERDRTSTDS